MPTISGADGCKGGWFCLFEEVPSRRFSTKVFPALADLFREMPDVTIVAIDIPIGLADSGPRRCDIAARKMLGAKRGTSVFPAPVRPALDATSYEDACARSFAAQGRKPSKQTWAIYPKIREVDELLRARPELCERVFEIHPEVSYCAWNRMEPILDPKRGTSGAAKRRQLIDEHFDTAAFDAIRSRHPRSLVADDDILDAFAALWTAERIYNAEAGSLPELSSLDSKGIPMRMMY